MVIRSMAALVTSTSCIRRVPRGFHLASVNPLRSLLLILVVASSGALAADSRTSDSVSPWIAFGAQYQVDPLCLYAIALQESRRSFSDGRIRPWPWTLHVEGEGSLYFSTYQGALRKLRELIAAGTTNVDVGISQISWRHQGHRVSDVAALLQVSKNVETAAQIVRENLDQARGDLRLAIARYHNPRPELGLPYAASVLAILEELRKIEGMREALAQDAVVTQE